VSIASKLGDDAGSAAVGRSVRWTGSASARGATANLEEQSLRIKHAGRVLHINKTTATSPSWDPDSQRWDDSEVRLLGAQANSQAYYPSGGTLFPLPAKNLGDRPKLDATCPKVVDDGGEVRDRAAEPVDPPHSEGVPGPEEVQAGDQLRPGGGGSGGVVGEDSDRASSGERVVLQRRVLLEGGHPRVADRVHARRLAGAAHKGQGP